MYLGHSICHRRSINMTNLGRDQWNSDMIGSKGNLVSSVNFHVSWSTAHVTTVSQTLQNIWVGMFVSTGTYCYSILYVNVLCCRKIFDDCRDNLASYFKDREPTLWTFHPKIVFERFQAFLKRLDTVKVLKSKETSNLMYNKAICSKKFLADLFLSSSFPVCCCHF
jgi:hypothetical protein